MTIQATHTEAAMVMRPMRAGEEDQVVAMVQGLAREAGGRVLPKLTPGSLRQNRDLIAVTVAAPGRRELAGACLSLTTFSTWRGQRGMYVVDLFVAPAWRGRGLGEALLREAARRATAQGAQFIKLEVDTVNEGAGRFYDRLGFARNAYDRLFVLEHDGLVKFIDREAGA